MNFWCLEIPVGWWQQFGPDTWADTAHGITYTRTVEGNLSASADGADMLVGGEGKDIKAGAQNDTFYWEAA